MTSKPLRLLELMGDDHLRIGHQHGETFRREIQELAEIRLERTCAYSKIKRPKDILALAEAHLPVLQEFDVDLFLEFRGIAESSNISLDRLVVLNHYTDLRDIVPTPGFSGNQIDQHEDHGGCSIIFSPTSNGPILGQTWDVHGSAEPFTIMIRRNDTLLFSVTGCLGMTGLTSDSVAIAINNLPSIDARVGILWPALIRKALTHKRAQEAVDEIMRAPLGSGRHFAVADGKDFFSIETSATKKKIVWDKPDERYFHTNHCLDAEMRKTHVIRKESTTLWRYQHLDEVVRHRDLSHADAVFLALAEVSLPQNPRNPHQISTCGTFVMDLNRHQVVACQGIADQDLLQWSQTKVRL